MAKKTYTAEEREARTAARRALDARVRACADDPAAAAALLERYGGVVRLSDPAAGYGGSNPIRLIMQAEEAGIAAIDEDGNERPLIYGGFHQWKSAGRKVKKGEHGAWIYSGGGEVESDDGESRTYIGTAIVFEMSQTSPMSAEEITAYRARQGQDEQAEEVA